MLGMLRLESSSFYSKLAKHHNSELEDLALGLPTPSGLIIFRLVPRFQGRRLPSVDLLVLPVLLLVT
jgi:hypothetical protein